ncbi:MAG: hypothetical protein K1X54_04905 [Flavobacteriales bacterium]|nr:hypothetical protein [Flavobacteriales bacterium]
MKKSFLTLMILVASVCAFAQHKVSVSAVSDFKTIRNGMVESTFVFDHELSASELAEFSEWTGSNAAVGTFNLSGRTLVTSIKADMNNSHIYGKMFHLLGVESLEVMVGGQKKVMDIDAFFAHFQL